MIIVIMIYYIIYVYMQGSRPPSGEYDFIISGVAVKMSCRYVSKGCGVGVRGVFAHWKYLDFFRLWCKKQCVTDSKTEG